VGLFGTVAAAFAAGFSVAASPGAVNLLGLRWGLQRGATAGLLVGLGAATADAFYVALTLTGVLPLAAAAEWLLTVLLFVGGIVLVLLGLWSVRTGAALDDRTVASPVGGGAAGRGPYLAGLVMTLANPPTMAAWLAITGGLLASTEVGDGGSVTGLNAGLTLAGVFVGSAAWFAILALLVAVLRSRIGAAQLRLVAIAAGLVLVGLGLLLIARGAIDVFA
jgi:threonine/homoserine/homoserine lactone efflux protein